MRKTKHALSNALSHALSALLCFTMLLSLVSAATIGVAAAASPGIPLEHRDPTDHAATPLHENWLDNAWSMVGMGGGGSVYRPTWSPLDPNLLMLRSDMGGAFISYDAAYTWSMLDFNNVIDAIAYDLYDENLIFVAGPGGLFKTVDKGANWKRIFPHEDRSVLQYRGNHADPYYVTPEWAFYDYTGATGIAAELGLRDDRYPNAPPPDGYPYQGRVAGIAIDPQNSDNIYTAVIQAVGQNAGFLAKDFLFYSADGGEHFALVKEDITTRPNTLSSSSIQASPTAIDDFVGVFVDVESDPADRDVFFISASGVYKITTSTGAMTQTSTRNFAYSEDEYPNPDFLYDPATETCTYYLLSNGNSAASDGAGHIVKTTDMVNFTQLTGPATFRGFTVASQDIIYANGAGNSNNRAIFYKSVDGGATWSIVFNARAANESNDPSKFGKGWMEVAYGSSSNGWSRYDQTRGIGASKANPDHLAATTDGIIFGTRDGGAYWEQMYTKIHDNGDGTVTYSTNGGNWTTSYGVHFDPFDPQHVFLTMTDVGLFQSKDGGQTWIQSDMNIPSGWRNTCYWLEFDPEIEGVIYSVWSNHHDYPQLIMLPPRQTESTMSGRTIGMAISYDGGSSWGYTTQVAGSGLPTSGGSMTHIKVDPNSPADARVLYIASMWRGVYKSSDGGRTWALKNNGIDILPGIWNQTIAADGFVNFTSEVRPIYKLAIAANGWVYASFARYGAEFIGESHGRLYVSKDQAETWDELPMPGNVNFINGLACDPNDAGVIYAAAWQSTTGQPCLLSDTNPLKETPRWNSGGIYKSTDGGLTWDLKWGASRNVYGLQIDPYNSSNVFAVTFNSELMVTEDAGETWRQVRGFDFKQSHSPFIDPNHPDFVFVTSYGGNIWRGPSDIAPKLRALSVGGAAVDLDPGAYEYKVVVERPVDAVEIEAACVYETAGISGLGNVALNYGDNFFDIVATNEIGTMSTTYTVNVYREPASAFAKITGSASVVTGAGATATYTVSADMRIPVSGIELEFEVDGDILSSRSFTAESGLEFFGPNNYGTPILWKNVGNLWIGKATLLNINANIPDIVGEADLLMMTFNVREGELGSTDVKLNNIIMSYKNGQVATMIEDGVATTELLQWYSKFDLNKDGVIDLNDLTFALQYLLVTSADPQWEDAKFCDFEPDGIIDINDLILILTNYTIPYYS